MGDSAPARRDGAHSSPLGTSSGTIPEEVVDHGVPPLPVLVQRHHQELYRFAFRLAGNQADAEDLVQQTYLMAQRKLSQLREATAARAWLYRILRTMFLKSMRKPRPCIAIDIDANLDYWECEGAPPSDVDPEQMQRALDSLPDSFRVVLLMYYFQDASYQQIASELELPLGTVMSRLARAKAHLRRKLLPMITLR